MDPNSLPAVVPKTRMTVTRLGHKIDDLHETMDTLHQEIEELKVVLKSLVKLNLELEPGKEETDIKISKKDSPNKNLDLGYQ
jgi:regulator of replication initiation timing